MYAIYFHMITRSRTKIIIIYNKLCIAKIEISILFIRQ
jgi:hypothetical protein